jgi:hypothetical protein
MVHARAVGHHDQRQRTGTRHSSGPRPTGKVCAKHPRPRNIGLLIEMSDTTLQGDREDKGPLYARIKVPVYWIINLPEAQVEVYAGPSGPCAKPAYRQQKIYGLHASIPVVLEGKEVGKVVVKNLFPE